VRDLLLSFLTDERHSDVPPVLWGWVVGIGHAPEMKEMSICHVVTRRSCVVELLI
jgi:hypothetical protein